jgi:hypothetical protein
LIALNQNFSLTSINPGRHVMVNGTDAWLVTSVAIAAAGGLRP